MEKASLLACVVAGHMISTVQKQSEMSTDAQPAISFQIPGLWDGVTHPQGGAFLLLPSHTHPEEQVS